MATLRVSRRSSAPTTDFNLYADLMSQDQAGNFSTVYYWVQAINRGTSSSYSGYNGSQTGEINGGGGGGHSGTMPSGVATGGQRWFDGPWGINIYHNAEGFVADITTLQRVTWPNAFSYADGGSSIAAPRIPKPPTIPGTPVASEILPTSMRLSWTAPTDVRGSAIDHYLLKRYETIDGTGTSVDNIANDLSRVITGLLPGKTYSWRVYAHNGSAGGYSPSSDVLTVATLAPVWVKVGGIWKYGIPYVKVAGEWKVGLPFVKKDGNWKMPS